MAKQKSKDKLTEPKALEKTLKPSKAELINVAASLSEIVVIQNIVLAEARVWREFDGEILSDEISISIKIIGATRVPDLTPDQFKIKVSLKLKGERGSNDSPLLFEIEATFGLIYTIPQGSTLNDDVVAAFAVTNGVFNAWPYWREFVHSTTARLGLPQLVIPVYRI